jgi:ribonuclease HI
MAIELVRSYVVKVCELNKHKHTRIAKVEKLVNLNADLRGLLDQLRSNGHDVDQLIAEIHASLGLKYDYDKITIYIDGAARGNNDPSVTNFSGVAFALFADDQLLHEETAHLDVEIKLPKLRNEKFGRKPDKVLVTANIAEYMALIYTLEYLLENDLTAKHIHIFSDSHILVKQVNREFVTKHPKILHLRSLAQELIDQFSNLTLTYIPRERNAYVDGLLSQYLDRLQGIQRDPKTGRKISAQETVPV